MPHRNLHSVSQYNWIKYICNYDKEVIYADDMVSNVECLALKVNIAPETPPKSTLADTVAISHADIDYIYDKKLSYLILSKQ